MLVRNRMSGPAVTVRQDADFQKALALMQEKKLRRLPVVDDDGQLVHRRRARPAGRGDALSAVARRGRHVMTRNVVTVGPDTDLTTVARTMLAQDRRLR